MHGCHQLLKKIWLLQWWYFLVLNNLENNKILLIIIIFAIARLGLLNNALLENFYLRKKWRNWNFTASLLEDGVDGEIGWWKVPKVRFNFQRGYAQQTAKSTATTNISKSNFISLLWVVVTKGYIPTLKKSCLLLLADILREGAMLVRVTIAVIECKNLIKPWEMKVTIYDAFAVTLMLWGN